MAEDSDNDDIRLYNRFGSADSIEQEINEQPYPAVEQQVLILGALLRHKPVGINRHFEMMIIQELVNKQLTAKYGDSAKLLTCEQIWRFLETLYDLKGLEASESINVEESEFRLPESYLKDKIMEMKNDPSSSNTSRSSTPRRSSGHTKEK